MIRLRSMKTRSRLLTVLTVAAALASVEVLIFQQSHAQLEDHPDRSCMINLAGQCLDCAANPQPGFGCTAHVPANWQEGDCLNIGLSCTAWANYNCGVVIACAWSIPMGWNCNPVTLCR